MQDETCGSYDKQAFENLGRAFLDYNHSYFMVMVQVIYDTAVFVTEEYQTKFKVAKSVQSLVEIPIIDIFGLSDATEMDQAMYNERIHQDLLKLDQPVYTQSNLAYTDSLSFLKEID